MEDELKIDCDDDAMDIMENVNDCLKERGLLFEWNETEYDGYVIYLLRELGA